MSNFWIEKYRPASFDEFVFQDDVTELHIRNFVVEQDIPHLMFSGGPGTGKTSCAFLLLKELGIGSMDTLLINASKENSVDIIRDKVSAFCDIAPLESNFKVVYLEEADHISKEGQAVMRRLMEEKYSSVRFIMTLNDAHKVSLPVTSRFQHFVFKQLPTDAIVPRVIQILSAEGVDWELDDLEKIIQRSPHDLRMIINTLNQFTAGNKLILPATMSADDEVQDAIILLMKHDKWDGLREYIGQNVSDSDIVQTYRTIYNNLYQSPKLSQSRTLWEQAVVHVAEYLYRNATVADPFINIAALTIELKRLA